jgi:hypothetical protein
VFFSVCELADTNGSIRFQSIHNGTLLGTTFKNANLDKFPKYVGKTLELLYVNKLYFFIGDLRYFAPAMFVMLRFLVKLLSMLWWSPIQVVIGLAIAKFSLTCEGENNVTTVNI